MTADDIPDIIKNKTVKIRKARDCDKCGTGCPTGTSMRCVTLQRRPRLVAFYHCAKCVAEMNMTAFLVEVAEKWAAPGDKP